MRKTGNIDLAYQAACLVRLNTGTGRRPPMENGKISARAFARSMKIAPTTVTYHINAYDLVAVECGLRTSFDLLPADATDTSALTDEVREKFVPIFSEVVKGLRKSIERPALPTIHPDTHDAPRQRKLTVKKLRLGDRFTLPNEDGTTSTYTVLTEPEWTLDLTLTPNSYSKKAFRMVLRSETTGVEKTVYLREPTAELDRVPEPESVPTHEPESAPEPVVVDQ